MSKYKVSKTRFLKNMKCEKYFHMERLKNYLNMSYDKTKAAHEEDGYKAMKLMESIIDSESYVKDDTHLKALIGQYNDVEELAMKRNEELFPDGIMIADRDTFKQKHLDVDLSSDIGVHCFLDGFWMSKYNSGKDWKIFEAKATTSKKFIEMSVNTVRKSKTKNAVNVDVFSKNIKGVYELSEEFKELNVHEKHHKKYESTMKKFRDKFGDVGKYIYDVAFQKYVMEKDLKVQNKKDINVRYYLSILNHQFIKDVNEDIESLTVTIDITDILEDIEISKQIKDDIKKVIKYVSKDVEDIDIKSVLCKACNKKKPSQCDYFNACFPTFNDPGSIFNYMNSHHPFRSDRTTKTISALEYFNEGKTLMTDIPHDFLNRDNNVIQRKALDDGYRYLDVDKIKKGLELLKYPLVHLDFESFNSPIPRFKGEKPYQQSLFQYSIHIENEPGVCDKDKDHYEFLSKDNTKDERLLLLESMLKDIPENHGHIVVWNKSFEESRLKELQILYPKYKDELQDIIDNLFDLMWILKGSKKYYTDYLGYVADDDAINRVAFYDKDQAGSYSIKAILPVLSDLTYKGMDISNGVEALVTYATYQNIVPEEFDDTIQNLINYCKQDTWAMVVILDKIRELCDEEEGLEALKEFSELVNMNNNVDE